MSKYILSFDAGTTSSRAIVFDKKAISLLLPRKNFNRYFRNPAG